MLQFGRIVIKHALAAGAVNACPVGLEICGVNHPGLIRIRIREADIFMEVFRLWHER